MEKIQSEIEARMIILSKEINSNVSDGNKAAGARARKITLELEKLFKEYRKTSIEAAKK